MRQAQDSSCLCYYLNYLLYLLSDPPFCYDHLSQYGTRGLTLCRLPVHHQLPCPYWCDHHLRDSPPAAAPPPTLSSRPSPPPQVLPSGQDLSKSWLSWQIIFLMDCIFCLGSQVVIINLSELQLLLSWSGNSASSSVHSSKHASLNHFMYM